MVSGDTLRSMWMFAEAAVAIALTSRMGDASQSE